MIRNLSSVILGLAALSLTPHGAWAQHPHVMLLGGVTRTGPGRGVINLEGGMKSGNVSGSGYAEALTVYLPAGNTSVALRVDAIDNRLSVHGAYRNSYSVLNVNDERVRGVALGLEYALRDEGRWRSYVFASFGQFHAMFAVITSPAGMVSSARRGSEPLDLDSWQVWAVMWRLGPPSSLASCDTLGLRVRLAELGLRHSWLACVSDISGLPSATHPLVPAYSPIKPVVIPHYELIKRAPVASLGRIMGPPVSECELAVSTGSTRNSWATPRSFGVSQAD